MADGSVSVLDSAGATKAVDAQTVGSTFQQTVTIGDGANAGRVVGVDSGGNAKVRRIPINSGTGTITSPAGSASSTTLLAANTSRLSFAIFNDSTVILYVAMAATASTSSYTFQMNPGSYYEPPSGFLYTGIITGIWASATGNARVTEYT
jgi:hypothetical protein